MTHVHGPQRYAVEFSVDGDIRYLSHQDMMRMFGRAIARGNLPVRYSEGFNPHPRISLPVPRPVGIASDVERLVVALSAPVAPDDVRDRLDGQMPDGIRIRHAWMLDPSESCVPARVKYRITPPVLDAQAVRAAADRVMRCGDLYVERAVDEHRPAKRIDIRPFIERIDVVGGAVELVLWITPQGTARPAEICGALGLGCESINHVIRRTEIEWH